MVAPEIWENGARMAGLPFTGPDLSTVTVLDVNADGLADVVKSFRSSPINPDDKHGVFFDRLSSSPSSLRLEFENLDPTEVALAIPNTGSSFLSAIRGLSVVGYWGNHSGQSVLWQLPFQNSVRYAPVFAERGKAGWAWKLEPSSSPLTAGPILNFVADFDGDGLADGYSQEFINGEDHAYVS